MIYMSNILFFFEKCNKSENKLKKRSIKMQLRVYSLFKIIAKLSFLMKISKINQ